MKKILVMAMVITMVAFFTLSITSSQAGEYYLGDILLFAGKYAPANYVHCDGRLLNIRDFEGLFMLIGTTYGGNGQTNFAVPDMRAAEAPLKGARYIICVRGIWPPAP